MFHCRNRKSSSPGEFVSGNLNIFSRVLMEKMSPVLKNCNITRKTFLGSPLMVLQERILVGTLASQIIIFDRDTPSFVMVTKIMPHTFRINAGIGICLLISQRILRIGALLKRALVD